MMRLPLSLRLTTGFVLMMIGTLLVCESLNYHFEYLAALITVIAVLGATISLFIISRSHDRIDLAAVAPVLLESTLDALTEGVVLLNNKERIIIANATFADIIGTQPASLKNISISRFGWKFTNSYENEMPWSLAIREGSPQTNKQMCMSGSDGKQRIFAVDSSPVRDSKGKSSGVMITFDDVTRLEEKNDQLENMLDRLKKSRDEIRRQNLVLQKLATRDSLTNCLNRRSFYEKYATVFRAAQRDNHALSCIMSDIDMFKAINDRHGHTTGDEVIKKVADALNLSVRSTDSVCRYGGEEFCIILPGVELLQAEAIAELARQRIEQLGIVDEADNTAIAITTSFGISSMEQQPANLSELIDRADKALYQSKHSGRNRVSVWDIAQNTDTQEACPDSTRQLPVMDNDSHSTATDRITYPYASISRDVLTGLPNRDDFQNSIAAAVKACRSSGQHATIMMLDLDMFKRINSTHGYAIGDELLRAVSGKLSDVLRSTDTVARLNNTSGTTSIYRLGGDEFGILLTGLDCTDFTSQIVNRVIAAITAQIDIQENEFHLSCSIGVSLFPEHGSSAETLLKNTSTALYYAKVQGNNNYRFYDEKLNKESLESLKLENDLRHAVDRNELELYYQPKIDLATGRVNSVEALVRWHHPELGMIPPNEFIPLAEETGLITSIGYWVLESACRQIKRWHESGFREFSVAVNLSAVQFSQQDLLKKILNTLSETDVCPNYLELEITESTIMQDIDMAASTMRALHCSGMRISIDDFGTGYSSLNHLKRFPINTIKIDRSFIRDITIDSDDTAIVSAIISMAHSMGLKVIAEGVETEQQLNILQDLQCNEIQGFLFSPPVPQDEATALLDQNMESRLQTATAQQTKSG
jgi:diguanylate cyclase (GGDEF)-like protein/PAS domain S-box-containing protein